MLSETFITSQIITAINCGFKVSILVQEFQGFPKDERFSKYNLQEKIIEEDIKIPSNKALRILKAFYLIVKNLLSIPLLLKYLKNHPKIDLLRIYEFYFYYQFRKFDIIHVQYGTNSKPFDVLKKIKFFSSPLIVSFHGHDCFFPLNGIIANNGYYNDLFSYGDLMVANTPYLFNQLKDLGCTNRKIKIIPVGVDTNFFNPKNKEARTEENFKLISVGRLDKVKGHIYAIDIVALLKNEGIKVILTIVGEGIERNNLENRIKERNIGNQVFLTGKKSPEEVRDLYWKHDLYIIPSIAVENNRRETQGLATIEAQACGLPAIGFDSGGVKYTISEGNSGFVVPEFDIESMAQKIKLLKMDRGLKNKMSINAVEFVRQNYSQEMIDKIWCKTYNNMIGQV